MPIAPEHYGTDNCAPKDKFMHELKMKKVYRIEEGFEINTYDWCVANKMIDGKQSTILWHVYDLKISHVLFEVVNR